jgi:CheY-like chemotaxis protein
MMGGAIDVRSSPGKGSTFTIVLPDQASEPAVQPLDADMPESMAQRSTSAINVLVVDDDLAVHDVLAVALGREGYALMHARDGAEALEIMRKTPPDVVTLDVMMPKVDGWSVLGIMKSEPALEHIPVIMLTIVDDRNLGYSLGASEFMTKPIDRNKLIALLRKLAPAAKDVAVLIVDDDADVRGIIKDTVESMGMKAATAVNGRAALRWLDENPKPDLILLDLMMPDVDGFEFLEKIRAQQEFGDVPVVVLTAKELSEAERNFLAERTLLVLSKSAQPIGSLGAALSAIAHRHHDEAAGHAGSFGRSP